jgi:hypothetical protein
MAARSVSAGGTSQPRIGPSATFSVLAAILFTFVACMIFPLHVWTLPYCMAVFNTALCVQQLTHSALEQHGGPASITFWSFSLSWFCVGSLAQLSLHTLPWPDYGTDHWAFQAEALATFAFVGYAIGHRLAGTRSSAVLKILPVQRVMFRLRTLAICSILLLPAVLAASGGLANRFRTLDAVGDAFDQSGLAENTTALFFLNRLPAACALVLIYGVAWQWVSSRKRSQPRVLVIAVAVTLLIVYANPFSSPRFISFAALVALLLGAYPVATRHRRLIFSILLTCGILFVYPAASWFKKTSIQQDHSGFSVTKSTFTGIDFDGFQTSLNTLSFVAQNGYSEGKHVLAAVGWFVPRSLWTTKSLPSSIEVSAARGYQFQNLSIPLWAELFMDLTLVGMIATMLLFGYTSGRLDRAYAAQSGCLSEHLSVVVAVGQFALLRGPLGGSAVFFGAILGLSALVFSPRLFQSSDPSSRRRPEGLPTGGARLGHH